MKNKEQEEFKIEQAFSVNLSGTLDGVQLEGLFELIKNYKINFDNVEIHNITPPAAIISFNFNIPGK